MLTIHPKAEELFTQESSFKLFKHSDLYCCVQRNIWGGNFNGYVAVPEGHPLFEKGYDSLIHVPAVQDVPFNGNWIGLLMATQSPETEAGLLRLDMAINVHGGLTYADSALNGIQEGLLGNLWWFGFDTAHAGDIKPYQTDIDRKYPMRGDEYRDLVYVTSQTEQLAAQIAKFTNNDIYI